MSVKVFCPCSEPLDIPQSETETQTHQLNYPTTIEDASTLHQPAYLNYCMDCQSIKCRRCIEPEIVTKYCPSCMLEMKPEYSFCSRNCLKCPQCDLNVLIHQSVGPSAKIYKFNCSNCGWEAKLETDLSTKTKSVARLIKTRLNTTVDALVQFDQLEKFYIQEKQLTVNGEIPKQLFMQIQHLNLSQQLKKEEDILEYLNERILSKFDPSSETEQLGKLKNIKSYSGSRASSNSLDVSLPSFTKLRTKCSKRCKSCRNVLMKPDSEPASTKFYKLSNAIDSLPELQVFDNAYSVKSNLMLKKLLLFRNTLSTPVSISISTFMKVPHTNNKINLPISKFTVNAKPENLKLENLIKTMSTLELTKDTKLARTERLSRKTNTINDNNVYEAGLNYIVIPLLIELENEDQRDLKIPIFISLESETVTTGYWVVVQL